MNKVKEKIKPFSREWYSHVWEIVMSKAARSHRIGSDVNYLHWIKVADWIENRINT